MHGRDNTDDIPAYFADSAYFRNPEIFMNQTNIMLKTSFVTRLFSIALFALFIVQCQPAEQQTEEQEEAKPEEVVVVIKPSSLTDSLGAFAASTDGEILTSSDAGQWLGFDLKIDVAGRYRTEVVATTTEDGASVWVEDYVGNPDGRTYNVTGEMPFEGTGQSETSSRDGSPFNIGTHKIRLHFNSPGIAVQELRFNLMRKHEITPVTLTQDMSGDEWEVVWSDEFDGTGLPDTSKWTFDPGDWGWGNNELQYYTDMRTENARLEDGNLIIEARKNDDGNAWTSARLTTRGKVTFTYGKIEFRAKLPTKRGNWAAGWTLGDAYVDELSWPYCGEIDIMESVGYEMDDETGDGEAHASVHCRAFYFKEDNHYTSTMEVEDMHNTYHTYGVIWTPEGITAYVDDKEYFTYNDTTDSRTWPFNEPQNIILNLAMGGGWGGAQGMDDSYDSQKMIIDYVRVYGTK